MGYTMIISEKMEAAARIATALDDEGTPHRLKRKESRTLKRRNGVNGSSWYLPLATYTM